MIIPASFESSWTEAEQAAFAILCVATGATSGKGAFRGDNPEIFVFNSWYFVSAPIRDAAEALLARDLPSFALPYYAECRFQRRSDCQMWAMRIMGALPIVNHDVSNLALLRIRDIDEIKSGQAKLPGKEAMVTFWSLQITLDLVFATGGKANLTSAID